MATINATITVNSLDELLDVLCDRDIEIDSQTMTSLPTFGGDEPSDTVEVWSWDEDNLIVGGCADDYRIVSRSEWFGEGE